MATIKRPAGFRIPFQKTLILVPERRDAEGRQFLAQQDLKAADLLGDLLDGLLYIKDTDWEIRGIEQALDDTDRKKPLVVICGLNPMWREIDRVAQGFMQSIAYLPNDVRSDRGFLWRHRVFRSSETTDYAVLAVRPNPFHENVPVTLIFGLRSIGTLGAAKVLASSEHAGLRKQIARDHGTKRDLEVLLRVTHSRDEKTVESVSVARLEDGIPIADRQELLPIRNSERELDLLYSSLNRFPRSVLIRDSKWEFTYRADYATTVRQEVTWEFGDCEVMVRGLSFSGDSDQPTLEAVDFRARQLDGQGEIIPIAATNGLRQKRYLLFPVPPIRTGEPARRYEFSYSWPGTGRTLRNVGGRDELDCLLNPSAHGQIASVTVRIQFDIPGAFSIVPEFPAPGFDRSVRYGRSRPFEFALTNAAGGRTLTFKVTRDT